MTQRIDAVTETCISHPKYTITIEIEGKSQWEADAVEGALEGYLTAAGCSVCTAELIGLNLDAYVDIFVTRFLPLITVVKSKDMRISVDDFKPLSYG